ncbi:hypothetical protein H6776_02595 [Candidatus Nomurabacteria bacterium]|nr:hypothetical protein [Candidatus Nomurabacteria bacterium]
MIERIHFPHNEDDPKVVDLIKEHREKLNWHSFDHIGSTRNGGFDHEWTIKDFEKQIAYLRKCDPIHAMFFFRVITRDENFLKKIMTEISFDPRVVWEQDKDSQREYHNSYEDFYHDYVYKIVSVEMSMDYNYPDGFFANRSDDDILEMLKIYNQEIEDVRLIAQENIERISKKFKDRLKRFSQKYDITIDESLLDHKLQMVEYDVFDNYVGDQPYSNIPGKKGGDYDKSEHRVRIKMDSFGNVDEDVVQHENLHVVAGREMNVSLIDLGFSKTEPIIEGYSIPRQGLGFDRRINRRGNEFTWLDEAITERINEIIMHDNIGTNDNGRSYTSMSYPDERDLFDLILTSGTVDIDQKYFFQAYFETTPEDQKHLPLRTELYQKISEAYGSPIFLMRIDDLVGEFGIREVKDLFKEGGKEAIEQRWYDTYTTTG